MAFANSRRRAAGVPIQYPDHLRYPFPKFAEWLNIHVRQLKEDGFPISSELESLHCPPSHRCWSFNRMWAFGCHFACSRDGAASTVAYDCGIAAISPSPTCTEVDVGILKDIVMVSYGGLSCVLMEGSWIKTTDEGRRVIKKDS